MLSIDTPETLKNWFMDQLSRHLFDTGYTMKTVDEQQSGAWTLVLHVPAQRLDVARIIRVMERARVCGSMGMSVDLPNLCVTVH